MEKKVPECFGDLNTVFPQTESGLRSSPETCFCCKEKTDCLKVAMDHQKGLEVKQEMVDRAYSAGTIGFLERWSKKKQLFKKSKKSKPE